MTDAIVHRLADDQFETIVNGLAMLVAELRVANRFAGSAPAPEPAPPGEPLDLWTFHDPHLKREVGAWVDDRNQVRHIPVTDADVVPRHWRRIRLDPARGEDD